jgi:WD40 repeat protein
LDALVDIELSETHTFELLYIPGIIVATETEEHNIVTNENKKYEELKENKKGSDLYTERGTQTLNLTQKTRELNYKGFT